MATSVLRRSPPLATPPVHHQMVKFTFVLNSCLGQDFKAISKENVLC
jgi:hypothetical protein